MNRKAGPATHETAEVTSGGAAQHIGTAALEALWTGGWDSTYIVLDAVLSDERPLRPHYVDDPDRPSAAHEIETMRRIHAALAQHAPEAAARLAPLRVVAKADIPAVADVDAWYAALSARTHVAPQYAWLSRYATTLEAPLALGIIRRSGGLRDVIGPELEEGEDGIRRLRSEPSDEAFELFRPFVYPTIELTKLDMRERARERGFLPLLELSWFCHEPRRNGAPCGFCTPCRDAREQGMGWRLTTGARWRGRLFDAAPGGFLKRAVRRALRSLTP